MKKKILRRPRKSRRGLTLIEVVLGTLIAIFVTSAAVMFATQETKLLGYSQAKVNMEESARSALDLLARDLEMAGTGIGYGQCPVAGGLCFLGLQTGPFRAMGPGGAFTEQFNTVSGPGFAQTPITLRGSALSGAVATANYAVPTRDLGILSALEQHVSVAAHGGGLNTVGQLCDAQDVLRLNIPILVALKDPTYTVGRSAILRPTGNAALGNCTLDQCGPFDANGVGAGCRPITFTADPWALYRSDGTADSVNYANGEAFVGLKQIIWWVANDSIPQDAHRANLRRAELGINSITGAEVTCNNGSRQTCGGEVAFNVEVLQYQVWRFIPEIGLPAIPDETMDQRWQPVPPGEILASVAPSPVNARNRLRVDVELVVRAKDADDKVHPPAMVRSAGFCMPGGGPISGLGACPAGIQDKVLRRVYRLTVDVKNSGRNS